MSRASVLAAPVLMAVVAVEAAGRPEAPGAGSILLSLLLVATLHALVGRMGGAGLRVDLVIDGELAPPPETAAAIARVVQEALTNAARHAAGSHVTVSVGQTGGELLVEIRDDGQGAPAAGAGFGLIGLDERIRGGLRAILDAEDDIQAVVAAYECGLVVPRG